MMDLRCDRHVRFTEYEMSPTCRRVICPETVLFVWLSEFIVQVATISLLQFTIEIAEKNRPGITPIYIFRYSEMTHVYLAKVFWQYIISNDGINNANHAPQE